MVIANRAFSFLVASQYAWLDVGTDFAFTGDRA